MYNYVMLLDTKVALGLLTLCGMSRVQAPDRTQGLKVTENNGKWLLILVFSDKNDKPSPVSSLYWLGPGVVAWPCHCLQRPPFKQPLSGQPV